MPPKKFEKSGFESCSKKTLMIAIDHFLCVCRAFYLVIKRQKEMCTIIGDFIDDRKSENVDSKAKLSIFLQKDSSK